eukprot:Filipodium_phascolosomae@DN1931_c0_g1_i1.p1
MGLGSSPAVFQHCLHKCMNRLPADLLSSVSVYIDDVCVAARDPIVLKRSVDTLVCCLHVEGFTIRDAKIRLFSSLRLPLMGFVHNSSLLSPSLHPVRRLKLLLTVLDLRSLKVLLVGLGLTAVGLLF